MPTYEYRRPDGSTFEIQQSFSDEALTVDPETGVAVQLVLHAPAVHFKGKGFYNTDYGTRNRQRETAAAAEKSTSEGSSSEGSSSAGDSAKSSADGKAKSESAGKDSSAKESGGKESGGKESGGKESSGRDSAKTKDSKPVAAKG
jgi:predicted nucleic acid-binding Zn ribbon protein